MRRLLEALRRRVAQPHLLLAVCSGALVMSIAVVGTEQSSPGPLSRVHAGVEGLAAPNACADCHGGFFGNMQSSCLECHEPIAHQLDDGDGLHGALGATNCAACHSEHHGEAFQIVNAASFAKAGFASREDFDHALIGWEMEGRHQELGCAECHANADAEFLGEGEYRFLGLSSDCTTCHEDQHEGAMRFDCTACHAQTGFDDLHSEGHDAFLHLIGGHAAVGCRDCHGQDTPHRLERIVWEKAEHPLRGCVDCHDSPHGAAFATASADLLGLAADASCASCHEAPHPDFRAAEETLTPRLHAASGFALDAPHDAAGCARCHDPEARAFVERHPGRRADDCAACHDDPHGGQFASGPFAEPGCVACHERTHFEPHAFTPELHEQAALRLEGTHLDTDCNACHLLPEGEAPREFRGTPTDCAGCHTDVHQGFFDPVTAPLEAVRHGDCARCHAPTTFDATTEQPFDHGRWVGFELAGAHLVSDCTICHGDAHADGAPASRSAGEALRGDRDGAARTFGRAAAAAEFGPLEGPFLAEHAADRACASCHFDPHEGRFDAPELPAVLADRAGCARCHGEASFRAFPNGFDHGLWTGWELTGNHAEASCTACHAPVRPERPGGRSWAPAAGTSCADCHTDVHRGQFERAGATDCARCHGSTASFADLDFDHDWDSRFPLHEGHERVECAACHKPTVIDGVETVRYRPLGRECTDCHGVRSGSLRRRGNR